MVRTPYSTPDARQALSISRSAAASIAPVAERIAALDSRVADVQTGLETLSKVGPTQGAQLAEVSKDLHALRANHEERLEGMSRRIQSHDAQLRVQDQELSSTKKWSQVVGASAAVGLGIVTSHTLGHSGR